MTRVGHASLTRTGAACLLAAGFAMGFVACTGATPRDMYFGTDAGADFEVPPRSQDGGADTTGAAGAGAATGEAGATAGAAGAAGAGGAGGADGVGGAAGDGADAATTDGDSISDGGPG